MKKLSFVLLAVVVGLIASCSSEKSSKDNKESESAADLGSRGTQAMQYDSATGTYKTEAKIEYDMSKYPHALDGEPVEVGGIRFTPESQWNVCETNSMRKACYTFGPLENDADSATLYVYYFGRDQGGTVQDNIERWINQTALPDGRDAHDGNIQYDLDVDGMKVHILSIYGFYEAPVGGPMSREKLNKENYRLVGAVVEGPQGNVFFKLTGPDFTAKIMIEGFMPMIKAITKV